MSQPDDVSRVLAEVERASLTPQCQHCQRVGKMNALLHYSERQRIDTIEALENQYTDLAKRLDAARRWKSWALVLGALLAFVIATEWFR